jgi:hypothetical protein
MSDTDGLLKEWWKASQASVIGKHPRIVSLKDECRNFLNKPCEKLISSEPDYNRTYFEMISGSYSPYPTEDQINFYKAFQKKQAQLPEYTENMELKDMRQKFEQRPEILSTQLAKKHNTREITLSYIDSYKKDKYYKKHIQMPDSYYIEGKKYNLSCSQKMACSSYHKKLLIVAKEGLICYNQNTFTKEEKSNSSSSSSSSSSDWICTDPMFQDPDTSQINFDVSDNTPTLHIVASKGNKMITVNSEDGRKENEYTTDNSLTNSDIIELKWNFIEFNQATKNATPATAEPHLAVIYKDGTLAIFDSKLKLIDSKTDAKANSLSWYCNYENESDSITTLRLCVGTKDGNVVLYKENDSKLELEKEYEFELKQKQGDRKIHSMKIQWIEYNYILIIYRYQNIDEDDGNNISYENMITMLSINNGVWDHIKKMKNTDDDDESDDDDDSDDDDSDDDDSDDDDLEDGTGLPRKLLDLNNKEIFSPSKKYEEFFLKCFQ